MSFPVYHFTTSQGIPVYYEEYPAMIRPMSIMLSMMAGGADDQVVGAPGIHHWGEHIPFRGTKHFPHGARQIVGRLSELGGYGNAYTNHTQTVYLAEAPSTHWKEAADIVVDLVAHPLCRVEDIDAERAIIRQEINQGNADIERRMYYQLRRALWGKHPYGDRVIGTHETLAGMDASTIERMRLLSYGRARCNVFIAGSMPAKEVFSYLEHLLEQVPENPVSERRAPASYGTLPEWKPGVPDTEETTFDATVVSLAFPTGSDADEENTEVGIWVRSMLLAGGLASPLYRIVREERQLAYSTKISLIGTIDGGCIALTAKTSRDKATDVVDAFWDVLALDEVRSAERFDLVERTMRAQHEMSLPDPSYGARRMLSEVCTYRPVVTEEESFARLLATPRAAVIAALDTMTREEGRVLTLLGK